MLGSTERGTRRARRATASAVVEDVPSEAAAEGEILAAAPRAGAHGRRRVLTVAEVLVAAEWRERKAPGAERARRVGRRPRVLARKVKARPAGGRRVVVLLAAERGRGVAEGVERADVRARGGRRAEDAAERGGQAEAEGREGARSDTSRPRGLERLLGLEVRRQGVVAVSLLLVRRRRARALVVDDAHLEGKAVVKVEHAAKVGQRRAAERRLLLAGRRGRGRTALVGHVREQGLRRRRRVVRLVLGRCRCGRLRRCHARGRERQARRRRSADDRRRCGRGRGRRGGLRRRGRGGTRGRRRRCRRRRRRLLDLRSLAGTLALRRRRGGCRRRVVDDGLLQRGRRRPRARCRRRRLVEAAVLVLDGRGEPGWRTLVLVGGPAERDDDALARNGAVLDGARGPAGAQLDRDRARLSGRRERTELARDLRLGRARQRPVRTEGRRWRLGGGERRIGRERGQARGLGCRRRSAWTRGPRCRPRKGRVGWRRER